MQFTLFDDYITLQALLKNTGIIQSGGAAKAFLAEHPVFLNQEMENRRGKKLKIGDQISIPDHDLTIALLAPSEKELLQHQAEQEEKKRVSQIVKEMNQSFKKEKNQKKKTVKFPGT